MTALIGIIAMLADALTMIIIVWFVIGLLFAFNVIDYRQPFLREVYDSIGRLLSPLLNPIRRILPETGSIDFSPMVLLLVLRAIVMILYDIAY